MLRVKRGKKNMEMEMEVEGIEEWHNGEKRGKRKGKIVNRKSWRALTAQKGSIKVLCATLYHSPLLRLHTTRTESVSQSTLKPKHTQHPQHPQHHTITFSL